MNELPYQNNCRKFIDSKLEEDMGDELIFIENRRIAVFSNIDKFAKFYASLNGVSICPNWKDYMVFFKKIPAPQEENYRSLWSFQLGENKEEFLNKYKSKLNLFKKVI